METIKIIEVVVIVDEVGVVEEEMRGARLATPRSYPQAAGRGSGPPEERKVQVGVRIPVRDQEEVCGSRWLLDYAVGGQSAVPQQGTEPRAGPTSQSGRVPDRGSAGDSGGPPGGSTKFNVANGVHTNNDCMLCVVVERVGIFSGDIGRCDLA